MKVSLSTFLLFLRHKIGHNIVVNNKSLHDLRLYVLTQQVIHRLKIKQQKGVMLYEKGVKSLPNDNFMDWTKVKAIADDKMNVAKIMISVFDMVKNIMGKGENAGYQHFSHFPKMFSF